MGNCIPFLSSIWSYIFKNGEGHKVSVKCACFNSKVVDDNDDDSVASLNSLTLSKEVQKYLLRHSRRKSVSLPELASSDALPDAIT